MNVEGQLGHHGQQSTTAQRGIVTCHSCGRCEQGSICTDIQIPLWCQNIRNLLSRRDQLCTCGNLAYR